MRTVSADVGISTVCWFTSLICMAVVSLCRCVLMFVWILVTKCCPKTHELKWELQNESQNLCVGEMNTAQSVISEALVKPTPVFRCVQNVLRSTWLPNVNYSLHLASEIFYVTTCHCLWLTDEITNPCILQFEELDGWFDSPAQFTINEVMTRVSNTMLRNSYQIQFEDICKEPME